jgi:hypothetical protein
MADALSHEELHALFGDIIAGREVKRSKHELRWGSRDVTLDFVESLEQHGYRAMTVADVQAAPGERVPAFFIEGTTAYFGWVFWEKFSRLKLRKLFGSVVRNRLGDWAVQIPAQRRSVIYANPAHKLDMDIENPSAF